MSKQTSRGLGRLLAIALPVAAIALLASLAAPLQAQAQAQSQSQSLAEREAALAPIDRVVAVVNQEAVTLRELESRMAMIEAQAREAGQNVPLRDTMRRQVLEQLILNRAQVQYAKTVGVNPSEAEIDRALTDIAQNNNMSVQQFTEKLRGDGFSVQSLREQVAAEIITMRLREREASNRVTISEAEIDAQLARAGNATAVEYEVAQILLRLAPDAPADTVKARTALADDIAARARAAGGDFGQLAIEFSEAPDAAQGGSLGWRSADRLPELFVNAVAKLQPGEVAPVVRSPAGLHVLRLVDRRSESPGAATVTQTRARHILLPAGSPVIDAEAVRRLTEFRSSVDTGRASFESLAKQFSTDGSARNGGDLGWLYPGETVPEFERAMNALQPGQISEPFRSPFGMHIVQVVERRTDASSPDRLRAAARAALREQKANEAFDQWLRELRDRAYVELRLEQS